ncbi:MAG: carboxypeptidase-like regulatory domain-containing protein [Gemmatimonadaceae bacterium]
MIRSLIGVALGVSPLTQSVMAQNSASLAGRVVHKASRAALAGADSDLAPGSRRLVTDDSGRFKFDQVPAGNVTLIVKRIGFVPESLYVTLGDREDVDVLVELEEAAQRLDTVSVAARETPIPRGRLSAFYERKPFGIGRFLEAKDFEDVTNRQMAEILAARLPGIRKVPLRGGSSVAIATSRSSRMATRRGPPGRASSPSTSTASS